MTTNNSIDNKSGRATPSPNKYSFIIKRIGPKKIQRPVSYQVANEEAKTTTYSNERKTAKPGSREGYQVNNFMVKGTSKGAPRQQNTSSEDCYKSNYLPKQTRQHNAFMNLSVNEQYSNPLETSYRFSKERDSSKGSRKNL